VVELQIPPDCICCEVCSGVSPHVTQHLGDAITKGLKAVFGGELWLALVIHKLGEVPLR